MSKRAYGIDDDDALGLIAAKVAAGEHRQVEAAGAIDKARERIVGVETPEFARLLELTAPPPAEPTVTWRIDALNLEPLSLTLPAERPLRLRIEGPASARFAGARLLLSGRPLLRDLADAGWGSTRADGPLPDGSTPASTFQFARPEPVTFAQVITGAGGGSHKVDVAVGAGGVFTALTRIQLGGASGTAALAAEVSALRFAHVDSTDAASDFSYHIHSPSVARRIGIGVVGGAPLQVLQTTLKPDARAESMDLAAVLNQQWQPDGADRGAVELELTSVSDGNVHLSLVSDWRRLAVGASLPAGGELKPQVEVALDPLRPVTIGLPALSAPGPRTALLGLSGELTPSRLHRDAGLLARDPAFSVQVDEGREIAQPLRLALPGPARERRLGAIWLWLEQVPEAEVALRLRLYPPSDEGLPDNSGEVAEAPLRLPADPARYRALDGGLVHRAELVEPARLASELAGGWFFVALLGSRTPVHVLHGTLAAGQDAEPITKPSEASAERGAGAAAGAVCWRNLGEGAAWQVRRYSRKTCALRLAVETLLNDADFPAAGLLDIGGQPVSPPAATLDGLAVAVPLPGDASSVDIASDIAGTLSISAQVNG